MPRSTTCRRASSLRSTPICGHRLRGRGSTRRSPSSCGFEPRSAGRRWPRRLDRCSARKRCSTCSPRPVTRLSWTSCARSSKGISAQRRPRSRNRSCAWSRSPPTRTRKKTEQPRHCRRSGRKPRVSLPAKRSCCCSGFSATTPSRCYARFAGARRATVARRRRGRPGPRRKDSRARPHRPGDGHRRSHDRGSRDARLRPSNPGARAGGRAE